MTSPQRLRFAKQLLRDLDPRHSLGAGVIHLKRLHEVSMMKIDASSVSFWAVANKSDADASGLRLLERQRVKVWLRNSFDEVAKPGI